MLIQLLSELRPIIDYRYGVFTIGLRCIHLNIGVNKTVLCGILDKGMFLTCYHFLVQVNTFHLLIGVEIMVKSAPYITNKLK
jgi:hypothetical protein